MACSLPTKNPQNPKTPSGESLLKYNFRMFGIELIDTLITLILSNIVTGAALYFAYLGGMELFKYYQSLYVEAKPNEWLVVMNNGKMIQAGIGIAMNRGPFDTVAVFPSRLVKVDIRAQQVTIEMQGLEVAAMIEWTIDKNGDGPMKAFMNLGSDLSSSNPRTANAMLADMACSILRNYMANCTIDDVIKNREAMRAKILADMSGVTKGWGVHLETVEVTDVRICSGTLFKNMQTKFREQ